MNIQNQRRSCNVPGAQNPLANCEPRWLYANFRHFDVVVAFPGWGFILELYEHENVTVIRDGLTVSAYGVSKDVTSRLWGTA